MSVFTIKRTDAIIKDGVCIYKGVDHDGTRVMVLTNSNPGDGPHVFVTKDGRQDIYIHERGEWLLDDPLGDIRFGNWRCSMAKWYRAAWLDAMVAALTADNNIEVI